MDGLTITLYGWTNNYFIWLEFYKKNKWAGTGTGLRLDWDWG